MKQKWTVEQRGETIGVFASVDEATEYAARVMRLTSAVEVDHGDHDEIYLYTDQAAMDNDAQGCHPAAVVVPVEVDHIPTYRA